MAVLLKTEKENEARNYDQLLYKSINKSIKSINSAPRRVESNPRPYNPKSSDAIRRPINLSVFVQLPVKVVFRGLLSNNEINQCSLIGISLLVIFSHVVLGGDIR